MTTNYGTWSQRYQPPRPTPPFPASFREGQRISVIQGVVWGRDHIKDGHIKRVFPIMPRNDKRRVNPKPGWLVVVEFLDGSLLLISEEELSRDIAATKRYLERTKVGAGLKLLTAGSPAPTGGTAA